jgi:hypothetical protein
VFGISVIIAGCGVDGLNGSLAVGLDETAGDREAEACSAAGAVAAGSARVELSKASGTKSVRTPGP